jgi:hypothetical protein
MYLSYLDIKKFKISLSSPIYGDMIRYSYIQLCSILDEFIILNNLAKDDEYLRDTLYVVSPALKAINKYNGIRKARNIMLAHFNRDKNANFNPWWIAMKDLKLPSTQNEVNQIYTWLHIINGIIVGRFIKELTEISKTSKTEVDHYFNWVKLQEEIALKTQTPLDTVYQDVELRMKEKNIEKIIIDPVMTDLLASLNRKK